MVGQWVAYLVVMSAGAMEFPMVGKTVFVMAAWLVAT